MPAAKKPGGSGLVAQLTSMARKVPVSNIVTLPRYYRSLDLLLTQIALYRTAHNDEQLYVMLLRYTSMVVETIKQHKDFSEAAPQYQAALKRAVEFMEELERLKVSLLARDIAQPQAHTYRRPAEAVRIEDSAKLKDIDWDAAAPPPAAAAAAGMFGAAAASAPPLPPGYELTADLEWPPRASAPGAPPSSSLGPAASGAPVGTSSSSSVGGPPWPEPVSYSSHYTPSNAQLLQKHSLFAPRAGSGSSSSSQQQAASSRVRYPSFNSSPIDAVWATAPAASSGPNSSGGGAAGAPDLSSLTLLEQQQALLMQPSAGPSLGPQEVEVQSMQPCQGQPGGSCAAPPPPPPPQQQQLVPVSVESSAEAAAAAAAGPKSLSKRVDLRDVHISVALMNDFLHYAANNTRRGIESCGILAGVLSASDSRFTVTTLIVPKQTGTSDTVEMLGEEEVWEVESSRELVPLGWIHTHPTQTCFLSSVDIHTQCGYQTMLDEAVAIVMAPTDSRKKCGIFRLTTPQGLGHVQRCPYRGFHHQCSSEHYELCGHVYLNPNAKHEVIDLRG